MPESLGYHIAHYGLVTSCVVDRLSGVRNTVRRAMQILKLSQMPMKSPTLQEN